VLQESQVYLFPGHGQAPTGQPHSECFPKDETGFALQNRQAIRGSSFSLVSSGWFAANLSILLINFPGE
jgi:hypothetical protein